MASFRLTDVKGNIPNQVQYRHRHSEDEEYECRNDRDCNEIRPRGKTVRVCLEDVGQECHAVSQAQCEANNKCQEKKGDDRQRKPPPDTCALRNTAERVATQLQQGTRRLRDEQIKTLHRICPNEELMFDVGFCAEVLTAPNDRDNKSVATLSQDARHIHTSQLPARLWNPVNPQAVCLKAPCRKSTRQTKVQLIENVHLCMIANTVDDQGDGSCLQQDIRGRLWLPSCARRGHCAPVSYGKCQDDSPAMGYQQQSVSML